MSDFPRLANSMSAVPLGFRFCQSRACATTALLALAAVTLPPAHAAARRSNVPASGIAHVRVAVADTHAARPAPHGAGRIGNPTRAAQHAHAELAQRTSRIAAAAKPKHSVAAARVDPVRAVRERGSRPLRKDATGFVPLSVLSAQPVRQRRNIQPTLTLLPRHTAPASKTGDSSLNREVEDRVHTWYRAQHGDGAKGQSPNEDVIKAAAEQVAVGSATPLLPAKEAVREPDLSPIARKATAADFHRAWQKQSETIRTVAAVNNTRTTADDDAAFAEASTIPSTAPTERVPAPFLHGDLPPGANGTESTKQPRLSVEANRAPVLRIDPRGDAEVLTAASNSAVAVHSEPADSVSLPALKPGATLRSPAPAAGAIEAAARKPKLDPRVANGIAAETFDLGDTPDSGMAVSNTAAHATKSPLLPTMGSYDVDLNAGPIRQVNLYDSGGKLILLPAMKGSHEILVHQNQMAIADGLDRVEDDNQMAEMRRLKLLVPLPDNDSTYPDGRLPGNRRFARPWAVRFLNDLARAHYQRFQTPLIVTSAVRTVAFQRRLVLTNGNAAPPTGDVASPHLYGQALDIAKHGMSMTEIAWMRSYLTPVETSGKIDVEEEFQQACFHISVYRRYLGLPAPRSTPPEAAPSRVLQQVKATPAKRHHLPTALLATGLR